MTEQVIGSALRRALAGALSLAAGCALALSGCSTLDDAQPQFQRRPGQGQYVYPQNQRPVPIPYTPQSDQCGAKLFAGLVGAHIGGVFIQQLGGNKRIIAPGDEEIEQDDFLADMEELPPLVTVTELAAGQPLYLASVRTVPSAYLGPDRDDRLTIILDRDGYIELMECR